ncbi:unnamed protein product [Paramecium primaurelia]|uniref:Uncharacterized protein n=1 Tax=Paramecium primaurelia TaxID=5886 RepID=A0A8S1NM27_PARPR|nr:unnamed protein product [Paramecium primaurelia]
MLSQLKHQKRESFNIQNVVQMIRPRFIYFKGIK